MVSSTSSQYLYHFRMPFHWLSEHGALYLHLTVLSTAKDRSRKSSYWHHMHFKAQKRCLGGSVANSLLSYTAILSWQKPALLAKSGYRKVKFQGHSMWFKKTYENFIYEPSKSPLPKSKSSFLGWLMPMTFLSDVEDTTLYHFAKNMPKHPIRQETMTTRPEQMLCGVLIIEAESTSASTATSGSGRSCLGAVPLAISCFPSPNHTWRFVPASPACPSKSFSCSSVTLHIARSKKPGSSWQYIQPFGKLLISSLASSKEMLSDNLSHISSAKQGFYNHQIGNCMKLQPHQPHQPLLEDFQRRVCSYPLYLSAAAPWDVQTCDVHPINSHSAPVPGSFCMLLATSASHPAQTRCI